MNLTWKGNMLTWAKELIKQSTKSGDILVDATVGNGYDTLFLAQLVDATGKVYGFDIQLEALEATRKKLFSSVLSDRVDLINDSHENMANYLEQNSVSAVMFNLGYLPGGNHTVTTQAHSTLGAVHGALKLLKKNGIITIVCYTGHPGGLEEYNVLNGFLSNLSQRTYRVHRIDSINQINFPPVLFVIGKL